MIVLGTYLWSQVALHSAIRYFSSHATFIYGYLIANFISLFYGKFLKHLSGNFWQDCQWWTS